MTDDARAHLPRATPGIKLRVWHVLAGSLIATAIVAGVVVWLVTRGSGSVSPASPVPTNAKALPITVKGLKTLASLGIVIYWVGGQPGYSLELRKTADDRVFIRYLPSGVPLGSNKPYLTIGTYPMKDAFAVTSKLAGKGGSVPVLAGKDNVAFFKPERPTSVFLAHRGLSYQVEVYDPSPGRARELVTSGQLSTVK
jgi:hypothetical protein